MGKFIDLETGLPALWARVKSYVGKGTPGGVAELDSTGHIPSSQLPAYVDDVLEFASNKDFPSMGESGKIYVSTSTNVTYRWSGSTYVPIGSDLALGETSSTAYRGDRGKQAYTHAVTNKGIEIQNGLYKITTNAEGHVTAGVAVEKDDILNLGITSPTKLSELENDKGYVSADGGEIKGDTTIESLYLIDDATGIKYRVGISNGKLYTEAEAGASVVGTAIVGQSVVGDDSPATDYIKPQGVFSINKNGTYDVSHYASATVNIPSTTFVVDHGILSYG